VKVYPEGGEPDQPETLADGLERTSVSLYPVTFTLSLAVNFLMGTVRDDEVSGMLNSFTVGGLVSAASARVTKLKIRAISSIPELIFLIIVSPFFFNLKAMKQGS
jgi:hypothetical protein